MNGLGRPTARLPQGKSERHHGRFSRQRTFTPARWVHSVPSCIAKENNNKAGKRADAVVLALPAWRGAPKTVADLALCGGQEGTLG